MLGWLKRISDLKTHEQLIEAESKVISTGSEVERLVERVTLGNRENTGSVAGKKQTHVIVVASQKGGVGKTTIAAHLAVRASQEGHGPAVVVDTDPQGSLTEWWQARKDEQSLDDQPALVTVKLDDLTSKLVELRRSGTAITIIDTPPALTASIERAIETADLVLVPARPSPHDLRAIGATVGLTRKAGKPLFFVVNGAAPRASITAEAVAALSEHGRVVPTILYQRTDFAASMIDGRTVMETAPSGRSAREIGELWKHVFAQITMPAAA
jgi:chromosome partitioning protein